MGYVNIEIGGSFANTKPYSTGTKQFSALEFGHVAALTDAIAHLVDLLPRAVDLDHRLQTTGVMPRQGFGVEWDAKLRALVESRAGLGEGTTP